MGKKVVPTVEKSLERIAVGIEKLVDSLDEIIQEARRLEEEEQARALEGHPGFAVKEDELKRS